MANAVHAGGLGKKKAQIHIVMRVLVMHLKGGLDETIDRDAPDRPQLFLRG